MKKGNITAILGFFVILFFFAFTHNEGYEDDTILDTCNSAETKKTCKKLLDPYSYDASKATRITFKNTPQRKELEIPLYLGEKYRFVFSKEGLPQNVDIAVYDHKHDVKKRQLLFSSKNFPEDQVEYIWEPEKSRKMYINYEIPATNDTIKKGCVVMVLGYDSKGN